VYDINITHFIVQEIYMVTIVLHFRCYNIIFFSFSLSHIGADYEPTVNEVQVPVLDRKLCNAWLKHKDVNITEGMICAGYEQGGKDACQVSILWNSISK